MPLRRTTTFNPRRVKRSASLGGATRKASKAGAKVKRTASLQEKRTAKTVALALKETKLFKPAWESNGYGVPQVSGKAMATLAFATTSAQDPSGNTTLSYGAQVIKNLNMARPFHNDNADDNLAQMALDGRKCIPTSAHNVLTISRAGIKTSTINGYQSAACAPLYVRMIVVTPKGPAGTIMETNPATDLFITAWGEETGISALGSIAMGSADLMDAVVNPNKYAVLRDEIKVAHIPYTDGTQLVASNGTQENHVLTVAQRDPAVRWRIKHQIAAKKGGELWYNAPNSAVAPRTGHRREYTLLHFWQPGQEDATTFAEVPGTLKVRCRPYSAFKDG